MLCWQKRPPLYLINVTTYTHTPLYLATYVTESETPTHTPLYLAAHVTEGEHSAIEDREWYFLLGQQLMK